MIPPPPRSTLFPYTTLFRSVDRRGCTGWRYFEELHDGIISFATFCHHADIILFILAGCRYIPYRTFFIAVDRKSTRLNSSHSQISYAVFCLKKKNKNKNQY